MRALVEALEGRFLLSGALAGSGAAGFAGVHPVRGSYRPLSGSSSPNAGLIPVITGIPSAPMTEWVAGHGGISLAGSTTDPALAQSVHYLWWVTVSRDGGKTYTRPDGGFNNSDFSQNMIFYPVDDGLYRVQLSATDDAGNTATTLSSPFSIINTAPYVLLNLPSGPFTAGQPITLSGGGWDSYDDRTAGVKDTWSVAQNGVAIAGPSDSTDSTMSTSFSFTPTHGGTYSITLTRTDKDGASQTSTGTVAVADLPAPGAPDLKAICDDGPSNTDNVTAAKFPLFDVTGGSSGDTMQLLRKPAGAPDSAYQVIDTQKTGVPLQDTSDVANGTYAYAARRQTSAGAISNISAGLTVTIDSPSHPMPGLRLVLAGIDSITQGAGPNQDSYFDYLGDRLRAVYGDGGPGYEGFDTSYVSRGEAKTIYNQVQFLQYLWNTNGPTSFPVKYSLGELGIYFPKTDGNGVFRWDPLRAYDTVTLYYLQLPGGGAFSLGQESTATYNGTSYLTSPVRVDTNGPLDLKSVTIHIDPKLSGQIGIEHTTSNVTIFGGLFTLGNSGVMLGRIARGSDSLGALNQQDVAFRQKWMAALQPSLYILDLGMNDRYGMNATQFESAVDQFAGNILAGSPMTQLLFIEPEDTADAPTNNLASFAGALQDEAMKLGAGFLNDREVLGSFKDGTLRGYFLGYDVHPTTLGNVLDADAILDWLGISPSITGVPPTKYGA